MWTQEKVKELLNEQTFDQEALNNTYSRKEKIETRQNIWYKLYMLQNYSITMNMFIGSTIRWDSICTYLSQIRLIYKNNITKYTLDKYLSSGLVKYINGLMDSGIGPYPVPKNCKAGKISLHQAINNKILTPAQIKYIYGKVGIRDNQPDTSSLFTRSIVTSKGQTGQRDHYFSLVTEDIPMSNPLQQRTERKKGTLNPFGFKINFALNLNSQ